MVCISIGRIVSESSQPDSPLPLGPPPPRVGEGSERRGCPGSRKNPCASATNLAECPALTPTNRESRLQRLPRRILAGADEPIFDVLSERVLDNLRRPASENALVWNLIYPLASPDLSLSLLLGLRPLWGTPAHGLPDDALVPYFWGTSIGGKRLEGLGEALAEVDGPQHATEVDLFLVGRENLVLAEAKHLSRLGRCRRYARGRCPEVHRGVSAAPCRYWESGEARFDRLFDFGPRPSSGETVPPCSLHYQMARTLLVGDRLADRLGLRLHVWLTTPRRRWNVLQGPWLDFVDRVKDEGLWRRLRVLAWEDVRALSGA